MGKPFWCHSNHSNDATITAREPNPLFPASVLSQPEFSQFRTLDRALRFNGIDMKAERASDSAFQFSTAFTAEMVLTPRVSGFFPFIEQGLNFSAASGWGVWQVGLNILVRTPDGAANAYIQTNTSPLAVGDSADIWVSYDGSLNLIEIWLGHEKIASGDNVDLDGCTRTGTIPSSLTVSTEPLKIGEAGGLYNEVDISFVGLSDAVEGDGTWIVPSSSVFYPRFQDSLADSGPNELDMTGTNVDGSDYIDYTGNQWVQIAGDAGATPDTMVLDHRGNLQDGADVSVWSGAVYTPGRLKLGSTTVVAGKPVVITGLDAATSDTFVVEITDDNSVDGYIKLFKIYLGNKSDMARGFLLDYGSGKKVLTNKIPNSSGNLSRYRSTGELMTYNGTYRVDAADKAILEAVFSDVKDNLSVVFCPDIDDIDEDTIFVDVPTAEEADFKKESKVKERIAINIVEKGIGLQ